MVSTTKKEREIRKKDCISSLYQLWRTSSRAFLPLSTADVSSKWLDSVFSMWTDHSTLIEEVESCMVDISCCSLLVLLFALSRSSCTAICTWRTHTRWKSTTQKASQQINLPLKATYQFFLPHIWTCKQLCHFLHQLSFFIRSTLLQVHAKHINFIQKSIVYPSNNFKFDDRNHLKLLFQFRQFVIINYLCFFHNLGQVGSMHV